jgi:NYN domain
VWLCHFGRLYELACPSDDAIGRSILFGSRPPANDSLWARANAEGFQVEVFDRSAGGREKQVDTAIVTVILEDSFQHMRSERGDMVILVAGDRDYCPAVGSLDARGNVDTRRLLGAGRR